MKESTIIFLSLIQKKNLILQFYSLVNWLFYVKVTEKKRKDENKVRNFSSCY